MNLTGNRMQLKCKKTKNILFIFSVMKEPLEVEYIKAPEVISGNRIVEINYVLNWAMKLQLDHNKICTAGTLQLESEKRIGLVSKFTFKCNTCERRVIKYSEDQNKKSCANYGAVWGTLTNGSTYTHLSNLLTKMDVQPCPKAVLIQLKRNLHR